MIQQSRTDLEIEKLKTYIPGLPKGRTTLVAGTAGSAKTVFAVQFLAAGILNADEAGVFVTFEESPDDIRRTIRYIEDNPLKLGLPAQAWSFVTPYNNRPFHRRG